MEFTDRMAAGRDAAATRRSRGLHTGKSAKGWNAKPRPVNADAGQWHHERDVIRVAWHMSKSAALELYERAAFPHRYAASDSADWYATLESTIAANHAAQDAALLATF